MKIVEEEDKNKNEEEKEINDEDRDDEETENDKEDEEEGEKESEEGDEEDGDENESDEGEDTESEEGDEGVIKTFNIDKFQVEMPIDDPTNLTGDFVVKLVMGAKFDAFRTILMNEKLEDFFKSSCFGYFLDLPEANNARFQISMVCDLLKRRIKYKGDDDDALEDKKKKMDEIWINYYGMPVCFSMKEFAIVTGLRCHPPSEPLPKVACLRKPREKKISKSVKVGKKELAGATTIKRETLIVSGDTDDVALDVDVDVNICVDIGDAGAKSGGEHVDDVGGIYGGFTPFNGHTTSFAPSSSSCSASKCEECKNKEAQLISTGEEVKKFLDALSSVVKELISKRGVIPSRKISEPFTPLKIKRRRKSISKILSNMKKRQQIATTPLPCNVESSSRAIEEQHKL
ncbi:hypothetical protein KY290_024206 [Solanum tuberosum]|uniref:DUF1985 domain-containing protein n=1 Tax=Solanum tuberosum TaxID=4113 RepID=A0ABQ7US33_SOLTU|nr:hypothetical protein KY290_024206 [Solanum tuberosum]